MTLKNITSGMRNRIKIGITTVVVLIATAFITFPILAATNYTYNFEPSLHYTQTDTKAALKIYTDNSGLPDTSKVNWVDPQGNPIPACTGSCVISDSGYTDNGMLDWRKFWHGLETENRTFTN